MALLQMRKGGSCSVGVPEELFDKDFAGHYFGRIKSVAMSIPCVTGPYSGVNSRLSLLKSTIRKSPVLFQQSYVRSTDEDDPRFDDYFGSLPSVVTSSGQNDSGMFEANLHDERYLYFEYAGAISNWFIELPDTFKPFDYSTISDVILHIRYTAREGGRPLRESAKTNLQSKI